MVKVTSLIPYEETISVVANLIQREYANRLYDQLQAIKYDRD